jgi:hypothetical protein
LRSIAPEDGGGCNPERVARVYDQRVVDELGVFGVRQRRRDALQMRFGKVAPAEEYAVDEVIDASVQRVEPNTERQRDGGFEHQLNLQTIEDRFCSSRTIRRKRDRV